MKNFKRYWGEYRILEDEINVFYAIIVSREIKHRSENTPNKTGTFITMQRESHFGEDDNIGSKYDYNRA
ncbi:hypothetical protein [Haloflavibacter putidus]|uniref:Uncharacterized protein n=1 Tax=Haloflavibacter putidus TaxID=2576776 RepID=A0A507Z7Q7_9FLAO|nr:hypothetical protein [Haloflavibacter putidus]TQD33500.1 hypothetical protein FKR84_13075 [Haloflavibacter putidus]